MSRTSRTMRLRGGMRLQLVQIALIVGVLVAASACGVERSDSAGPPEDFGVSHVHGLGVNPADGALFVATHYGMFRIDGSGSAARVGESYQDTMGFTVVGPNEFLGSGHPDVAGINAGLPGLLGLVRSGDAGESWDTVSLTGEVDFHTLVNREGIVYGWDSTGGRFMVSTDRITWDTRSTIDLVSFVVDPADGAHVVAATPAGIVESADGGRSWSAASAPVLATLSWESDAGLWGVDPSGDIMQRSGARWTSVGSLPSSPQALLVESDVMYAAAGGSGEPAGIYRSSDGRDWTLLYQDPQ